MRKALGSGLGASDSFLRRWIAEFGLRRRFGVPLVGGRWLGALDRKNDLPTPEPGRALGRLGAKCRFHFGNRQFGRDCGPISGFSGSKKGPKTGPFWPFGRRKPRRGKTRHGKKSVTPNRSD
jgi:hypothetical protein